MGLEPTRRHWEYLKGFEILVTASEERDCDDGEMTFGVYRDEDGDPIFDANVTRQQAAQLYMVWQHWIDTFEEI